MDSLPGSFVLSPAPWLRQLPLILNMKKIFILGLLTIVVFVAQRTNICGQQLPIKSTRTISFETAEGTYMNVDISAEGKTIAFDLLGDIYTLPADGGKAVQLTRGLAYNRCPVWSPDGKRIAYLSDTSGADRLCIMNADGTGQRTLDISAEEVRNYPFQIIPAWTPDGKYIAVNRELYHIAGGRISLPSQIYSNVQFSGDGNFLFYGENYHEGENIQRYNRSSGEVTKLVNLSSCDRFSRHCVSPNGLWLAYVTGPDPECSLRLRNLRTGEDRLLADSIQGHQRDFRERYTFTPDSRSVLIGYGGKIHRIDLQTGADRMIPFQARVNVDLGPFDYNTYQVANDSFQVRFTRSANTSADGKMLVFTAVNRIYVMTIPGDIPHPLVSQPFGQFQPVFSPDSRWIAYVTWSDTQGGAVWRVPVGGGEPERLTTREGYYVNPTWSIDGRQLAVIRDTLPAQRYGIYNSSLGDLELITINDKISRKLADSIPLWNHLSFSPDGTTLTAMLISGFRKSIAVLESISLDGKKEKLLAVKASKEMLGSKEDLVNTGIIGMQQITVSPDNRYIVYGINEDLYLMPLPALGKPVMINSLRGIRPVIRFATGGLDPNWERGGKILSWSYGHQFYRINPDKIIERAIAAAKDSAAIGLADNGVIQLQVAPDETIDLTVKAGQQYGHGSIAFRDVRIISMKGDEVIENGTVVVTDGRIVAVGPTSSVHIPARTKVIDGKGKTIMPGMIDVHDHCSGPLGVFVQQSWEYLANLAYGVTTARDPATSYDAFGYAELLKTGQMTGPRLFGVGYAVGEGNLTITSLEEAQETIRKRAKLGAIAIKQYKQKTRLQRQWVLMACREQGLNMTNEGDYDLHAELAMIKDGSTGVEHAYEWTNIYRDVIQFMARSGTWHTPTLQAVTDAGVYYRNLFRKNPDGKLERFWPIDWYERLMKSKEVPRDTVHPDFVYTSSIEAEIFKQGGHVGLGAHGNDPGIGSHWELWALQKGGLSNLDALKVATISGAEALGVQKDLGSLEPGKIADMIVLDKNPLEDIHNTLSIEYVMKDGILYNGNTLNTVWPVKRQLPKWREKIGYTEN